MTLEQICESLREDIASHKRRVAELTPQLNDFELTTGDKQRLYKRITQLNWMISDMQQSLYTLEHYYEGWKNMDAIVSIISSVGFPIAMCLVLLWYINKKDEQYVEQLTEMESELDSVKMETTKALVEVNTSLMNNTRVIERNTEVLDNISKKLGD